MISSNARDELLTQPGIEWVDQVLTKPATPSTLLNSVAGILSHRKQHLLSQSLSSPVVSQNRLQGVRILVVDDSEINREVALRILESEGAQVNLANDGQQALNWLQQHPAGIDIVLMDVQMPVMDGYSATQKIRQDQRWTRLPIVALTAASTLCTACLTSCKARLPETPLSLCAKAAAAFRSSLCR
jgi:FOG: CheY-like receiver